MEEIMNYINPELLILIPVLYLLGVTVKNSKAIRDEYIPFINGLAGIVLAALWVIATNHTGNGEEVALAIFTAIVQGVLCAGCATYLYEALKQGKLLKVE